MTYPFRHEPPTPDDNETAGSIVGGCDYGVFNVANLIANALHGKDINQITSKRRAGIYKKSEFDVSDLMPVWVRLGLPE